MNDDGKNEVQAEPDDYKDFTRYKHCRLVCHDWDVGVQTYFQLHDWHFSPNEPDDIWLPYSALRTCTLQEPCRCPMFFLKAEVDSQLEKYSVTHPPSKNPIFSRAILLLLSCNGSEGPPEEEKRYRASLDTLLERYGRHIWHCQIDIEENLNSEACRCIWKWISLMPELKTLQLVYEEEINPISMMDLQEIENIQLTRLEMKKLVLLNSSHLPAVIFNKLVGNIPLLEKIQIEIPNGAESFLRDFELMIEKEKLKEAFLTLKGFEDFQYLQDSQPFPNLTKLVMTLGFGNDEEWKNKAFSRWPEWRMIFKILGEKFSALEDFNLRLPKAISKEEKKAAIDHSLECQLNLPKLKKLWVALPNLSSLDFLHPCKKTRRVQCRSRFENLEHSECNFKGFKELPKRGREKINFNMDLTKMWESNICKAFPKLCKLKIWVRHETRFGFGQFTYERNGAKKKSDVLINP